jgi:RNA recognition motif-containing protein
MSKKLFVGSLDWGATEQDLQELFSSCGAVEEAIVIKDKFSGRSKGFGFVTFTNDEDADKALEELNESELKGRKLVVSEARPPRPRD